MIDENAIERHTIELFEESKKVFAKKFKEIDCEGDAFTVGINVLLCHLMVCIESINGIDNIDSFHIELTGLIGRNVMIAKERKKKGTIN